jgi:hypothetical protein
MGAGQEMLQRHGLNVDRNPLGEEPTTGGPPEQSQDWPGSDAEVHAMAAALSPGCQPYMDRWESS